MIKRSNDSNFLTLAEVRAEQGHKLPPELLPVARLHLLRGIARSARGDSGAREDLQRAAVLIQGLRVDEDAGGRSAAAKRRTCRPRGRPDLAGGAAAGGC